MKQGKGSILVVDDTLAILRLLVDMLVNQGYDVRPAPNGALALRAAQSIPPDLILLDIKMPGMDGYTVCEKLKASPETQDIPVIFISALNEVLDKVKAFSVGAVDYITKPFQLEEVLARIETHLTLRQLQKKLQERTHQLSTLLKVSHQVVSMLEVEPVLDMILDQLYDVVTYKSSSILTLTEDDLILVAYRGPRAAEHIARRHFPAHLFQDTIHLFPEFNPLVVGDVQSHPEIIERFQAGGQEQATFFLTYTRSWIGAPLVVGQRVIGLLSLSHDEPNFYSDEDIELLSVFVNHAAVAIENATLYKQAQIAAAAEERNRLARDLHDSVTQSLYSSTLFIEASRELMLADDSKNALHYLTRTGQVVQQALKEMRLLVYQLRPPELKEKGLIGSLQQRLDTVEKRAGVQARLLMDDLIELPIEVEEHLYRIAQEALNNSLKHAQAEHVKVYLRVLENQIMLEIVDDGQGFNPYSLEDQGGLGLSTMRERAEEIGGTFMIDSEYGKGTSVQVKLGVL